MENNRLIKIEETSEVFFYQLSPFGKKCQFLQFLINTSNLTWRKPLGETLRFDALKNNLLLVSKLCAIGYLLNPIKDSSISKAVVAVNSEKGLKYGTGKSLFARVLSMAASTIMIDGRSASFFQYPFLFSEISHETRLVVLDDVIYNNLEPLYQCISGDWNVNIKGGLRFRIPHGISPRILITRENPYSNRTLSSKCRTWHIVFSDYYNAEQDPVKEFGNAFEYGWDREQLHLLNKF